MNGEPQGDVTEQEMPTVDESRRDFMRKGVYAAYATPVIMSLLISKKSAAASLCETFPFLSDDFCDWFHSHQNGDD